MQNKILNYFNKKEVKLEERIENSILSTRTPVVYINNIGDEICFGEKIEEIYNYCYRNNYKNIRFCYSDEFVYDGFDYEDLLEEISDGAVEHLILYSIKDITRFESPYELLYKAKINNCKIDVIYFDEDEYYIDGEIDLLKYIANIEE